jgi:hypothetical protein
MEGGGIRVRRRDCCDFAFSYFLFVLLLLFVFLFFLRNPFDIYYYWLYFYLIFDDDNSSAIRSFLDFYVFSLRKEFWREIK